MSDSRVSPIIPSEPAAKAGATPPAAAARAERSRQRVVREMLASPEAIRSAFLLREILGPPVALEGFKGNT